MPLTYPNRQSFRGVGRRYLVTNRKPIQLQLLYDDEVIYY